jgi:hypothetical protein
VDLETGRAGTFRGTATITRDQWTERGRLTFGAYDGPATRHLKLNGDNVAFADGRPFHTLGPRAEHRCGEDVYEAEYRVLSPDAFDVLWTVIGPAKRLRLASSYRRATVTINF